MHLLLYLQLDDDDFQLPAVSELPTLESILNEHNPASVSDDDLPSSTANLLTISEKVTYK